ncbi:hypothetical protein GUJ93_ZPchr0013g37837 [Zizania palustris]|uniref:C2H2-type domain-containing protein n=1 Tax=Zizania palustris TaxID=103762 RepID=A0A8J6BYW9_ZIZPA|nr:hypothetical protein GUJ93_ZPchr0013g37837 [Zizania palustris]
MALDGKPPVPPPSPPPTDSWACVWRRSKRRGGVGGCSSGSSGGVARGGESVEHLAARCLMMIASAVWDDVDRCTGPTKRWAATAHKTSHRKPALSAAASDEAPCGGIGDAKVHRCSLCFRTFPSGQALGGHKRLHYDEAGAAGDAVKDKHAMNDFDLNLPAAATAVRDDVDESSPPEAKRTRIVA